jgi:aspartate aminotransferase
MTMSCHAEAQVDILVREYHIYLLKTGRVSLCGLNDSNLEYVADAIAETIAATSARV